MNKMFQLPVWTRHIFEEVRKIPFHSHEDKMELAIRLSNLNVKYETGGPFGAAIFNLKTQMVIAIGVNRVVPDNASMAHAEMMALMMAQEKLRSYDLGARDMESHSLVVNAQPCAMCYGAIIWSGVKQLICGARGKDVENITGFDEGPIHPNWVKEANKRGVEVINDIFRDEACFILKNYVEKNGIIYNGRGGEKKLNRVERG